MKLAAYLRFVCTISSMQAHYIDLARVAHSVHTIWYTCAIFIHKRLSLFHVFVIRSHFSNVHASTSIYFGGVCIFVQLMKTAKFSQFHVHRTEFRARKLFELFHLKVPNRKMNLDHGLFFLLFVQLQLFLSLLDGFSF